MITVKKMVSVFSHLDINILIRDRSTNLVEELHTSGDFTVDNLLDWKINKNNDLVKFDKSTPNILSGDNYTLIQQKIDELVNFDEPLMD